MAEVARFTPFIKGVLASAECYHPYCGEVCTVRKAWRTAAKTPLTKNRMERTGGGCIVVYGGKVAVLAVARSGEALVATLRTAFGTGRMRRAA